MSGARETFEPNGAFPLRSRSDPMSAAIHDLPRRNRDDAEDRDDLLSRYLGALSRYPDEADQDHEDLPVGYDVRTCANCGERAMFKLDPDGGWAACTACGKAA
jgi:hypothetical protein